MSKAWLCAIALAAGCSGESAWEEGPIGEIYEGLSVGGSGGCSTFIVDGLSKQLIAEQNCIRPSALVSFAGKKGLSIGSSVYPYLEPKAAAGLEAAGASTGISINSAFRTIAQQYLLYRWYQSGQCGIGLAAVPGNSNHETGIAVDVGNYGAVLGVMQSHGWSHSYPSSDPVHYDYTAGGTIDLRSESVLAFQKLWNLNNPGDKISEDGSYGAQTGARIAKAPATGFAKGTTCTPKQTPAPAPSDKLAAKLVAQSMPQTLGAGEAAASWVEFQNTGTATWTPGITHLGTSGPHDRDSALAAPDWLGLNRPASVDAETKPGEVGRFSFFVRGPAVSAATALSESFELVQEGVAWFGTDSTFSIDVEIHPSATTMGGGETGDPTADPTPASMAGGAHGGCSVAGVTGRGEAAPAAGLLLVIAALALFRRRRASYPSGATCRVSVESSFSWSSRSRS
ncbi:MAG: hypothetical protein JWN44_7143 [Myxococcales bacterium]|nr:hypothetical protein [Myxococcales bacterium]